MEKLSSEIKRCLICMDVHPVMEVRIQESIKIESTEIDYFAEYIYCRNTDFYLETEDMMRANQLRARDAYNKNSSSLETRELTEV